MKHRISVALASYNGEKHIEKQLQSIFHQSRKVDEIIIYDDRSSDHTIAIVKQFQFQDDIVVKIFLEEQRVGYIENFANALRMTSGTMIFLCDQDDIWEEDKVEKVMRVFSKHDHVSCVNTSFEYIDAWGHQIESKKGNNNHHLCWKSTLPKDIQPIAYDEILYHNISMGCTMAFTYKLRDQYLSTSNFQAPHDWELNYLASLKQGLYFYNESLIQYRIHEKNTIGNDKMNQGNHIQACSREINALALQTFVRNMSVYRPNLSKDQLISMEALQEFHEIRYEMLSEGTWRNWFKLLKRYSIYKNIVSKKGVLTDLLYCLHK